MTEAAPWGRRRARVQRGPALGSARPSTSGGAREAPTARAPAVPASARHAVAVALDAELEVAGPNGSRRVPAADFFLGTWTTTIESDEILAAVHFPVWPGRAGFAVEEIARRSGDFALAGVV